MLHHFSGSDRPESTRQYPRQATYRRTILRRMWGWSVTTLLLATAQGNAQSGADQSSAPAQTQQPASNDPFKVLQSTDADTRKLGIKAMCETEPMIDGGFEAVLECLKDPDDNVRGTVLEMLDDRFFADESLHAIDRIHALWNTNPTSRQFVPSIIPRMGKAAPKCFDLLRSGLQEPDIHVQYATLSALAELRESAMPLAEDIARLLDSQQTVHVAISSHAGWPTPLRLFAAQSLGRIGVKAHDYSARLAGIAANDDDDQTRVAAALAAYQTGGRDKALRKSIVRILQRSDSEEARVDAVVALADCSAPADNTVDLLRAAMHDNSTLVRMATLGALKQASATSRRAKDAIQRAATFDQDRDVRREAKRQLKALQHPVLSP